MYLALISHCMTEILAKECKNGKSTVLALGTVVLYAVPSTYHVMKIFQAFSLLNSAHCSKVMCVKFWLGGQVEGLRLRLVLSVHT